MDEWTEDYLEDVFLRDLDGTGSMHPCSSYDEGAVRYAPRTQFRCNANSACYRMEYELVQFCRGANITADQKRRLLEIARTPKRQAVPTIEFQGTPLRQQLNEALARVEELETRLKHIIEDLAFDDISSAYQIAKCAFPDEEQSQAPTS